MAQPAAPAAATAGPAARAPAARPPILPEKFAGALTDSWPSWLHSFEQVAAINGWNAAEQGQFLGISLTGEAQLYFQSLPQATRQGPVAALVAALQQHFAPAQWVDLHRATFKAAKQGKEESLGSFCEAVRYTARLAYPNMQAADLDVLAKDQFVQGLDSRAMRVRVRELNPNTLDDALQSALQHQAIQRAEAVEQPEVTLPACAAQPAPPSSRECFRVLHDEVLVCDPIVGHASITDTTLVCKTHWCVKHRWIKSGSFDYSFLGAIRK